MKEHTHKIYTRTPDIENPRREKPQRMHILNYETLVRMTSIKVIFYKGWLTTRMLTAGGLIA